MLRARRATATLLVCAVATSLVACTPESVLVDGSTVTIASSQAFTSYNDKTSFGNTAANSSIVAATNAGFIYHDDEPSLVFDESFGLVEVVSQQPFSVRYTVAEDVLWSDGVPVDGADLLLAWAANSGAFSTEGFDPSRFIDDATGQFNAFPQGTVYFDGSNRSGLQHVSAVPEIGEDGRSITLVYDEFFVDWPLAFDVGLAAHVVAEDSFAVTARAEESRAAAAKRMLIAAITSHNASRLAALASTWNSAFTLSGESLDSEPLNVGLLVGTGPYLVSAVSAEEVTLTANPLYTGSREPRYESVVIRTITDPLAAVDALRDGSVDVIAPTPTSDVVAALNAIDGVTVDLGASAAFEHLDLQFSESKNGTFDDPLVREAFLATIPRVEIINELVAPIDPAAVVRDSFLVRPGSERYDALVATNGSKALARPSAATARRLLEQAGVVSPVVCILFDPANPRRLAEFQLVKASAEEAGFVVTDCSQPDWTGFLGVPHSYDAAIFAWDETTDAATAPAARLRSTSTVSNYSHYASEKVDALLLALEAENDPVARDSLLDSIDAELWADAYGVPLYQFPALVAYSSTVQNVSPGPFEPTLTWNLWQWQPAPTTP